MVMARFLPRDERFFDYFRDAATNAAEASNQLLDLLQNYQDVERKVRRLRDIEHRTDEITHSIFNALNRTFVTPLDREDIRDLAGELDDLVDMVEEVGKRIWLYRIEQPTEQACMLARIIQEQTEILRNAIPLLEHRKHADTVLRHTVEINRLENEADDVLNDILATVFDGASDIPSLVKAIRWSELYQLLEDATDRAEDVANVLEGIVLKNA